jgi:uncharacterized protein YndB with AHSA1/START domain
VSADPREPGLRLRLRRELPAGRTTVYRALTQPEQLAAWWGPEGFTIPDIEFDPRVGGRYRITMQPPDGGVFHLAGEFREVDPPARLAFTFRWDPPDPDDRETLAALSLEDGGEHTELQLTQGDFATEDRLALHRDGWGESLDRLERMLSG